MKNIKNIALAAVAVASFASVAQAGKALDTAKDIAGRHMWTGVAAATIAALGAVNNTVVRSMVKKARTRNPKKANLLNNVQKGTNWALAIAALATAYGASAVEANHSFNQLPTLTEKATADQIALANKYAKEGSELAEESTKQQVHDALYQAYLADAIAAARKTALGDRFDGRQPAGYLAKEARANAADKEAVKRSEAYDAYQSADETHKTRANSHLVEQNGFMRFVRNWAPFFAGPAALPAAPVAPAAA